MSTATSYGRTLARADLVDARCLAEEVQRLAFELHQLKRDHTALCELVARLKVAHVRHVTETHAGWSTPPAAAIAKPAAARSASRSPVRLAR